MTELTGGLEFERLSADERAAALAVATRALVDVVREHGTPMDRQEAMVLTARRLRMSVVEMKLVLSAARAGRHVVTGARPSEITLPTA